MYNEVRALVNCISEDTDDYPDQSSYRMVMRNLASVKIKLEEVEQSRAKDKAHKELQDSREKIANEEWEKADLTSHIESDDIHIESDGWESDGTLFSRRYYVSVDGKESTMHHLLIVFVIGSDKVLETNIT